MQGRFGGAALAGGGGGGIYQMDTLNLAGFLNLTNPSFDLEAYCVICVDHKFKKKDFNITKSTSTLNLLQGKINCFVSKKVVIVKNVQHNLLKLRLCLLFFFSC